MTHNFIDGLEAHLVKNFGNYFYITAFTHA